MPVPSGIVFQDTPNVYSYAVAVTLGTPFTPACRALYFSVAGNATITLPNGDVVTFNGIAAGTILPVRATNVASGGPACIALY